MWGAEAWNPDLPPGARIVVLKLGQTQTLVSVPGVSVTEKLLQESCHSQQR